MDVSSQLGSAMAVARLTSARIELLVLDISDYVKDWGLHLPIQTLKHCTELDRD
jgi:hypothetical protein